MAIGPVALRAAPAALALAVILTVVAACATAIGLRAGDLPPVRDADWAALRFTLLQAALSAGISVALAVPVARALARRRFRGRGLVIMAMGAPFILPAIVAILGLLAVFGRGGWLNDLMAWIGGPRLSIYGLHGVVIAHVFFNLPLAVRLILGAWLAVPAERFRLAASLGFGPRDIARHIERRLLVEVVPGALLVIFLVCLSSFAVALTLGGGPRATTLEAAIYQAFRFDFDLGRAALLAVLQAAMCLAAAVAVLSVRRVADFGGGLDRLVERWDAQGRAARVLDAALLSLVTAFLILPLAAVTLAGLPHVAGLPVSVWAAALRSLLVAGAAMALTLGLALPLALVAAQGPRALALAEGCGALALALSPLVLGTGLFLALRGIADPVALALPVTALVNALMALPFALRILIPAAATVARTQGRLADSLGMPPVARLRIVTLPRLRRPMGLAAGLAGALSVGDLGVAALFADPARATLPVEVMRLMGAYRMDAAAGAALVLLAVALAVFWLLDRGGRVDAVL
jgi:thiamine transport system permease protein